jgi:hypothetical protein
MNDVHNTGNSIFGYFFYFHNVIIMIINVRLHGHNMYVIILLVCDYFLLNGVCLAFKSWVGFFEYFEDMNKSTKIKNVSHCLHAFCRIHNAHTAMNRSCHNEQIVHKNYKYKREKTNKKLT